MLQPDATGNLAHQSDGSGLVVLRFPGFTEGRGPQGIAVLAAGEGDARGRMDQLSLQTRAGVEAESPMTVFERHRVGR